MFSTDDLSFINELNGTLTRNGFFKVSSMVIPKRVLLGNLMG